jgi:SAM-dependent methyltransferase
VRAILRDEGRPLGDGLVVDIGSNDGTLLSGFRGGASRLLGVEPCKRAAEIAIAQAIPTIEEFFDEDVAERIVAEHGPARIVSAANVFYHVEDLHSITRGIKRLLAPDGVFVMQGSYLPHIVQKKAFDIMYHEHLLYYRLGTLARLLDLHDMEVFDAEEAPVHGGSVVVYATHRGRRPVSHRVGELARRETAEGYDRFETYERFSQEVAELRDRIVSAVRRPLAAGRRIYCYGAPAKGTVLLNYCGLTSEEIPFAVERNPLKVGRFIPGTGIEIIDEAVADEPDYYLLLAWNFLSEFLQSPAVTSGRRRFIVPLPEPCVLP